MTEINQASASPASGRIGIRRVTAADLGHVAALDERVTGNAKPEYWQDIFERYATRRLDERFFLIAEATETSTESPTEVRTEYPILGYIVGEVRGWEFGSEPCGWIFAFSVEPGTRQQGIGEHLFEAMTEQFKSTGIKIMRTMVPRQNQLHMAFFRSEGMVAGPYIQLEKELDD